MKPSQTFVLILFLSVLFILPTSSNLLSNINYTSKHNQYCTTIFSHQQLQLEQKKNKQLMSDLKKQITLETKYILPNVVSLIKKQVNVQPHLIENVKSQLFYYLMPFIVGIVIAAFTTIFVCLKVDNLKKDKMFNFIGLAKFKINHRKIGVVGFVLVVTSIIILSYHGIKNSQTFVKGVNQIFCQIFDEPVGFRRNPISHDKDYTMVDFANQLKIFEDIYTLNHQLFFPFFNATNINSLIERGEQLLFKIQGTSADANNFGSIVNKSLSALKGINQISFNFQKSLIFFNMTMQFMRQVIIGYRIGLNTISKYGNRYIGLQNLGNKIGQYYTVLYCSLGVCSIAALFGVLWSLYNKYRHIILIKNIFSYGFTLCCLFTFVVAVINSILVPLFYWTSQFAYYLADSEQNLKNEFSRIQFIDQTLIQMLQNFSPSMNGDLTNNFNVTNYSRTTIKYLQILISLDIIQQIQKDGTLFFKSDGENGYKLNLLNQYVEGFTPGFMELMKNAEMGLNKLLLEMNPSSGSLGRLDASAFGKYIFRTADILLHPIFNGINDHRWICSVCSFLSIAAIFLMNLVRLFPKKTIKSEDQEPESGYMLKDDIQQQTNQNIPNK